MRLMQQPPARECPSLIVFEGGLWVSIQGERVGGIKKEISEAYDRVDGG